MELNQPNGAWKSCREIDKVTGKPKTKSLKVSGEKFSMIKVVTEDEGGKMGLAIVDNLIRLYQHQAGSNIFGTPKLILNDPTVPADAGGVHSIGTGEISQGKPTIQLPPSDKMDVSFIPGVVVQIKFLDLEHAAVMLHEVNHAIHKFVNNGEFMHPNSSRTLGAVHQNLNMGILSNALQVEHNYRKGIQEKKANEMETYWLCCCDAAKYQFSQDAITAIKKVNNLNLVGAGYSQADTQEQIDLLQKNVDDNEGVANIIDIEKEDPTQHVPFNPEPFEKWKAKINQEGSN